MKHRNRYFKISITVFLSLLAVFYLAFSMTDSEKLDFQTKNESNTVGPITASNSVEQTFISTKDGLTRIDLLLATYARTNTSNVFFQIIDESGNEIFSQATSAASIKDNAFYTLDFDTIANSEGKIYNIIITSDAGNDDNAITAWASAGDLYTSGTLYLNDTDVGYDIVLRTFFSTKVHAVNMMLLCMFALFLSASSAVVYHLPRKKAPKRHLKYVCWIGCASAAALSATAIYNYCALNLYCVESVFSASGLLRTLLFFIPCIILTSLLFFDYQDIVKFLFTKRWAIAGVLFVVLVASDINLSNVSVWNEYIQPSIRSEFSEPILSSKRPIRSDEWLCDLTRKATGELVGYGAENDIVRGTYNSGLAASGLYLGYSALSNPCNWGYYLFGFEYGTSFYWMSLLILSFMISFELAYIVSGKKRLAALLGGCAIGLSQFLMWWSIPGLFIYAQAIIVCIYYFVLANRKLFKVLLALGTVFSATAFVTTLYPAWQVPLAYTIIAFVLWIVISHWQRIKAFKKFDWLTIIVAFVFMISVVFSYLYDNRFYIEGVMNTVYPGHRTSTGGGGLYKVFFWVQSLLYPFADTGNNSEAGMFFCLFPLPMILSLINVVRQIYFKLKEKTAKIDSLNLFLLILTTLFTLYCTLGISEYLAKTTLMSYSFGERIADMVGFLNVILLIRNLNSNRMNPIIAAIVAVTNLALSVYVSNIYFTSFMHPIYIAIVSSLVFGFAFVILTKYNEFAVKSVILVLSILLMFSGISVLPITRGVESLKSKPAALEIQNIVKSDPDAKWAGNNSFTSNYAIANGAKCITSINYLPNIELWRKLDLNGQYEEIYNRYAHISLELTDNSTQFELLQTDSIKLSLDFQDMKTCEIEYLFSTVPWEKESDAVDFELLYSEDSAYIFKVHYL